MPHLSLQLLGSPRVSLDDRPIAVDTRKAIALMAYLAVTRQAHRRETLAALLWPEADQVRAHAALRRTLSALNKALGGVGLAIEREAIGWDDRADVSIDVTRFEQCLAECRSHGHASSDVCDRCAALLAEAADLYRDDFLAGFSLRDSAGFDDWQFFQAESLRRARTSVLERLVHYHTNRAEFERVIAYARTWLTADPLHEPAHRHLMQAYAMSGQRSAALRQYQECVRVLKQELDVSPLPETTALYEAIKANRLHPAINDQQTTGGEARPRARANRYPLVGRARELETLSRLHADVASSGHWVIIEGEAGYGKTRMADEFATQVRSRGAAILAASGHEGEASLPYALFSDALRSALSQPACVERLRAMSSLWLGEAARLVPELAALIATPLSSSALDGPGAQSRFYEGVAQTMLAACRGQPTGVILLDDLHWADGSSLDLLTYLVRRLHAHAVFIVGTWRSEHVSDTHRLSTLASEAERAATATRLTLSPLEAAHVAELARWASLPDDMNEQLYHETEGVPFFVVEYLDAIVESRAAGAEFNWSMPRSVRDLLRARVAGLHEAGRQILQTAGVIGRSFDLDALREASGRSDEETVSAVEALVAQRLIREASEAESTPTYDFSQEKLRELVYEEIGLARRRLLHLRVARTLAARERGQRNAGRLGQIAHHFRLAGQTAEAAPYFRAAGDQARSLYANVEALAHYQAALATGHPEAAALHEAMGDLHTLLGEYPSALSRYETAAALHADDAQSIARLEHKIGNVYQRQGERDLAEIHYQAALGLLGEEGDPGARAQVYTDWSLTAHHQGRVDAALELAQHALRLADAARDRRIRAQAHNMLGVLARHRRDFAAASQHLQQSLSIAEETGDSIARVAALNNLSLVDSDRGDVSQALSVAEQALAACAALGDRHREAALHNNLADVLHKAGQSEAAMVHLKRAVTIFAEIGKQAEDWQPEVWKLTEW